MNLRNKLLIGLLLVATAYIILATWQMWIMRAQQTELNIAVQSDLALEREAGRLRYIVLEMQRSGFQAAMKGDEYQMMAVTGRSSEFFAITSRMHKIIESHMQVHRQGRMHEHEHAHVHVPQQDIHEYDLQLVTRLEDSYRQILSALLAVFSDAVEQVKPSDEKLSRLQDLSGRFDSDLNRLIEEFRSHLNSGFDTVLRSNQWLLQANLIAIFLFLLLIIFIAIYLERQLTRPVAQIEAFLHRASGAKGQMTARMSMGRNDELGRISRAVDHLLDDLESTTVSRDRLEAAMLDLKESEQNFRDMAASAQDAIVEADGNGNISFWNPAAARMFGYTAEEVVGRNVHETLAPPQLRENAVQGYSRYQKSGIGKGIVGNIVEMTGVRKDGSEFPLELSVSAVRRKSVWGAVGILRDITARKEYEKELHGLRIKAEQSSQAKSEFLANMSHEIRTPMNAIIGMSQLALQTELAPKQRNYIDRVHRSAEDLLGIINDILDFSKIESGKLEMEVANFRLEDVMDSLANLLALKAEEKGIQLSLERGPAVPTALIGDPLRLGQVLTNLGNNAVKFTEPGGKVNISVHVLEQEKGSVRLQFTIEDTGVGMSDEQQARLFQSFTQADSSTTRKYGGTGLGLVISKSLVEMMGGKIWFESSSGQGSCFHFTVQLQRQLGAPSYRRGHGRDQGEGIEAAIAGLRGARVLLVEDNEINQELALELLESNGLQVEVAGNGQQALERLREGVFDGVLMDCQMPVMDGYTATRRIREQAQYRELPIIAMTANAMAGDREKVLEAGMNDHVAKPIDVNDLFGTMAKWFRHDGQAERTPSLASTPQREDGMPELPGIDINAGLTVTMGKVSLYRKLLLKTRDNYRDFTQQFREAQKGNDPDGPARLAHSLKGVAGNIGATGVQQAALALEMACREGADNIDELLDKVVSELQLVISGLSVLDGPA